MVGRKLAHDQGRPVYVGPRPIWGPELDMVDVPSSLDDVDDEILLTQFRVSNGQVVHRHHQVEGLRVAMVSPFGVPCGISTYSEWLWEAMRPLFSEGRVFAEIENGATESADVTRCWTRGQPLMHLVDEIEAFDPDVVLVQMEYGYFPQARHWLSLMGALSHRRVVVTLHSVYALHQDKGIVENACPEIIVHTEQARNALIEAKGVLVPVHVIPHGCTPANPGKLWNLLGTPHSVIQAGFAGRYKGLENSLQVVAKLKDAYPDIHYTSLISERVPGSSKSFATELNALARRLGVAENVGLIRGFQSEKSLDQYLRTHSVALFPYRDNGEHAVLGCSGAARVAMSAGIPVVAAGVPLFEDLEGVVPRPTTVEGWAQAVTEAFENPSTDKQDAFLLENSWANAASRYIQVLLGGSHPV